MKDTNELASLILNIISNDLNFKINKCPIIMDRNDKRVIVYEVAEKPSNDFLNEIWEKINKDLNYKVVFNRISFREKGKVDIFFLTEDEIRIGNFYSTTIFEYEFLSYARKRFFSDKKNRFIVYKKIEFILSNIAFRYSLKCKIKSIKFRFLINEIFLDEIFLDENIVYIMEGLFSKKNFKEKPPLIEKNLLLKILKNDPISISKYQSYSALNYRFEDKGEELDINNLHEFSNEIEKIKFKDYDSKNLINYNMTLENYLYNKNIIKREYAKLINLNSFDRIVDQNMESFLYKGNNLEYFIKSVFLNEKKYQIKLLIIMSDIMRFVDSEYKKVVKPAVFSIEDFLIDILFRTSLELLEINRNVAGENYRKQIVAIANDDKVGKEITWFHEYPSLIFRLIQSNNKSTSTLLNMVTNGPNNIKSSWKNLKYFVESERIFKFENNMNDWVYSKESFENILEKYSKSTRLKFDLNFILRKLSFSNLLQTIRTLNYPKEYDNKKYKFISLMQKINESFDQEEMDSLIEMRNAISHQDIIFNSLNRKVEEHEKTVIKFLELMKENRFLQSYTFQESSISINIKQRMDEKLKGITNHYKLKENKKIRSKLLPVFNFIDSYYLDLFGRRIFDLVDANDYKSTMGNNYKKPPIKSNNKYDNVKDETFDFISEMENKFNDEYLKIEFINFGEE